MESLKSKAKTVGKKRLFNILTVFLLTGVFIFFGYTFVNQRADISRLENQKMEVAAKYEAQEQENKELQAVLDSDDKDAYIEQKAREKGYVKSDEIVFYDISAGE